MPAEGTRRSRWSTALAIASLAVLTLSLSVILLLGWAHGLRQGALATPANVLLVLGAASLAGLLAVGPGLAAALYASELLVSGRRRAAKALLDLLAGVPAIVWTLITWEALVAGPSLGTLTALLFLVGLPHFATLAEDALRAVPGDYRRAAHDLGATDTQTALRVVLPAALPGLRTAATLTFARLLAEALVLLWIVNWSRESLRLPSASSSPGREVLALAAALASCVLLLQLLLATAGRVRRTFNR